MSQLDLALQADASARHLSFVETGRARASREMLLRLGQALNMPLRDQNVLLAAAGFAPAYSESWLDDAAMRQVSRALDLMLAKHEPYPAFVIDRLWNMVRANGAAQRLTAAFIDPAPVMAMGAPPNALRMIFDPALLRPFIEDWEGAAALTIVRARREAVGGMTDAELEALIDECLAYPGVPQHWRAPDFDTPAPPVLEMTLVKGAIRQSWFTAVTSFGTPADVTVQELRIETFFPADEATEAMAKAAAG
jgi:transcriptional regulator with XRE-family HTH domain